MAKHNFFFSNKGLDNNGNGGPRLDPKFWGFLRVEARDGYDYDAVLPHLPGALRGKIQEQLDEHREEYPDGCPNCGKEWEKCKGPLNHFIADTAGWGNGFTVMGDEEFLDQFAQECALKGE